MLSLNCLFFVHFVVYLNLNNACFCFFIYATSTSWRLKFIHTWCLTISYLIRNLHFLNSFCITFIYYLYLFLIWIYTFYWMDLTKISLVCFSKRIDFRNRFWIAINLWVFHYLFRFFVIFNVYTCHLQKISNIII